MHADDRREFGHSQSGHDHGNHAPAFDLGEEERLPWLESADDVEAEHHGESRARLIGFVVFALIVLALLIGAIYWLSHRRPVSRPADGSTIEASRDPYKIAPVDAGGKQFAGTGDTSFKVSEGEHPEANLAGTSGATATAASPAPTQSAPAAAPSAQATAAGQQTPAQTSGTTTAVQVGAYSSSAKAESAWSHLVDGHDVLKSMGHRVVEGRADIGTVYRLQALAPDTAAANSLCNKLQADGIKCQVKR